MYQVFWFILKFFHKWLGRPKMYNNLRWRKKNKVVKTSLKCCHVKVPVNLRTNIEVNVIGINNLRFKLSICDFDVWFPFLLESVEQVSNTLIITELPGLMMLPALQISGLLHWARCLDVVPETSLPSVFC